MTNNHQNDQSHRTARRQGQGQGHDRCKYPRTTVFAKVALEAAAGRFSLNRLSASRLTDVDLRTYSNCKWLIARHSREISSGKICCSAHQAERLTAAMLLAGCDLLCIIAASVPRGCNCVRSAGLAIWLPACNRGCNCASQAKKACSASIQTARQRTGHGRCKYPRTTVFAKMVMEAAVGQLSLNGLSASRLTDVDLRTYSNCKWLTVRHFRKHRVPGKFHPAKYGALRIRRNASQEPQCRIRCFSLLFLI